MTPDVLNSFALSLLLELERDGFDLRVRHCQLFVRPPGQLTPHQRQLIHVHKAALIALVHCCDSGVQERLSCYTTQLSASPDGITPSFVYRPEGTDERGLCFSCNDRLPDGHAGRCWRCSLAWRLAMQVPIPADTAAADDQMRLLA